ncbi:hypothetical protein B0T17DRAFT_600731 [Bombardia bombarda]|uniref:Uncharacterized protein n=1 Tax=Bombardia bombarda TaxID=252184 RepID=A0AA39WUS7_9PEZI|nr:hypothetical protein B0T17DRAFT_600731 [Bombardia bombarda]
MSGVNPYQPANGRAVARHPMAPGRARTRSASPVCRRYVQPANSNQQASIRSREHEPPATSIPVVAPRVISPGGSATVNTVSNRRIQDPEHMEKRRRREARFAEVHRRREADRLVHLQRKQAEDSEVISRRRIEYDSIGFMMRAEKADIEQRFDTDKANVKALREYQMAEVKARWDQQEAEIESRRDAERLAFYALWDQVAVKLVERWGVDMDEDMEDLVG